MSKKVVKENAGNAGGGAVYGLGVIGALVYFIPQASSLWEGVIAVFKSIFWPAFFVYYVFQYLNI